MSPPEGCVVSESVALSELGFGGRSRVAYDGNNTVEVGNIIDSPVIIQLMDLFVLFSKKEE